MLRWYRYRILAITPLLTPGAAFLRRRRQLMPQRVSEIEADQTLATWVHDRES